MLGAADMAHEEAAVGWPPQARGSTYATAPKRGATKAKNRVMATRGRPVEKKLPPRIDATPEEMAQAMFALPADYKW